jgi:hypothetical protein
LEIHKAPHCLKKIESVVVLRGKKKVSIFVSGIIYLENQSGCISSIGKFILRKIRKPSYSNTTKISRSKFSVIGQVKGSSKLRNKE